MTARVTLVSPKAKAVETSDPATPAAVHKKGNGKGKAPPCVAQVGRDCAAVKKSTTAETIESESWVQKEAQARRLLLFGCCCFWGEGKACKSKKKAALFDERRRTRSGQNRKHQQRQKQRQQQQQKQQQNEKKTKKIGKHGAALEAAAVGLARGALAKFCLLVSLSLSSFVAKEGAASSP